MELEVNPPTSLETNSLVVTEPTHTEVIPADEAVAAIPVENAAITALRTHTQEYAETVLLKLDPKTPAFDKEIKNIYNLGRQDMEKSSNFSNRMLERPMREKEKGSPQTKVATTLSELRQQITELDPNRADLKGIKKAFKFLPGGNKVDAYFNRYVSAKDHLDAITASLRSGQDELMRDNAAIQVFREDMWNNMQKLKEYAVQLEVLDEAITKEISRAEQDGETERKHELETKALFAVRQRMTDLQTQAAVSLQGYFALDLIQKNNEELIRGVDRARTTTMDAMRTAIIVGQALGAQERVLNQINSLNSTTSNIIEATSVRLREQGAQIQQQASSATIDVQKLETSFQNVYAAMDELDNFKVAANESFARTIGTLKQQIAQAEPRLERMQLGNTDSSNQLTSSNTLGQIGR